MKASALILAGLITGFMFIPALGAALGRIVS